MTDDPGMKACLCRSCNIVFEWDGYSKHDHVDHLCDTFDNMEQAHAALTQKQETTKALKNAPKAKKDKPAKLDPKIKELIDGTINNSDFRKDVEEKAREAARGEPGWTPKDKAWEEIRYMLQAKNVQDWEEYEAYAIGTYLTLAPERTQHDIVLVGVIYSAIMRLKESKQTVNKDAVISRLTTDGTINGMDKYTPAEMQRLEAAINWTIEHHENKAAGLGEALVMQEGLHWAHDISDTSDEFNLYYWDGTAWSNNATFKILQILRIKGRHLESFNPNESLARHIKNIIATNEEVTIMYNPASAAWKERTRRYLYNQHGQVYDLKEGELRAVDPTQDFFKTTQIGCKIAEEASGEWDGLIRETFEENDAEIFAEFASMVTVHKANLGAKPYNLTVRGDTNTNKSVLEEILKAVMHKDVLSDVPRHVLAANPRWAKFLLREKMLNIEGEVENERLKTGAIMKDITTAIDGTTEIKGGGVVYVSRFPYGIMFCNTVALLPIDEDKGALFEREKYIETRGETTGKDWRAALELDDFESPHIQGIARAILERASRIYNEKPHVQSPEEAAKRYRELTTGDFEAFWKEYYERCSKTEGVLFTDVEMKWNQTQKTETSNKALTAMVKASEGFEKASRHSVYSIGGGIYTEIAPDIETKISRPVQKTVILGIRPKKQVEPTASNSTLQ